MRRREERFLAEGPNAVTAALDTGAAHAVLVAETAVERYRDLIARATDAGIPIRRLTDRAVAKVSDTATPAGVLAECSLLERPLEQVLAARPGVVMVPVEMSEPGNAGTLIRTADALGADAVVLVGDSVDPHNGKCVRASAGSVFHVPIARERDLTAAVAALRDTGLALLATSGAGELDLPDAAPVLAEPVAWLFGNEAHGLPEDLLAAADHRVRIPITGRAESLNLAAAASICMYATGRAHDGGARPTGR